MEDRDKVPITESKLKQRFARAGEKQLREEFAKKDREDLFEIKPVVRKGDGLFAAWGFEKDNYIISYWGRRISKETYQLLERGTHRIRL